MTVNEFSKLAKTTIEVKSGYNGKVLCKAYSEKKHSTISEREITAIWAEIRTSGGGGYGNFAQPVICVYVHGGVEYDTEHKNGATND